MLITPPGLLPDPCVTVVDFNASNLNPLSRSARNTSQRNPFDTPFLRWCNRTYDATRGNKFAKCRSNTSGISQRVPRSTPPEQLLAWTHTKKWHIRHSVSHTDCCGYPLKFFVAADFVAEGLSQLILEPFYNRDSFQCCRAITAIWAGNVPLIDSIKIPFGSLS